MYMLSQGSEILTGVSSGLSAQGNSINTTSVMDYGVNVFTTVESPSNFATKLPQPVTGRVVVVVNKGNSPLYVFPSNVGGQIGVNPVSGAAIIPADGQAYTIYCIENPQPGQWAIVNQASASQFIGGQNNGQSPLTLVHTNGTNTFASGVYEIGVDPAGTGQHNLPPAFAAWGGGYQPGNLDLFHAQVPPGDISDYWKTLYTPTAPNRYATALKWQTNVQMWDGPGGFLPNGPTFATPILFFRNVSVDVSPTGTVLQDVNTNRFDIQPVPLHINPQGYQFVFQGQSGVDLANVTIDYNLNGASYNGNIGDYGTIDFYIPFTTPIPVGAGNIPPAGAPPYDNGLPATIPISNNYFAFFVTLMFGNKTGTYKFVPYLEYF